MIRAQRVAERAHLEQQELIAAHAAARAALTREIGGGHLPSTLMVRTTELRAHVRHARHTLAAIEALPVTEGAQLIRDTAARVTAEAAEAARHTRAAEASRWDWPSPVHPAGPQRGFGPTL